MFYKIFNSFKFNTDLKNAYSHETIESCVKSDKMFLKILNRNTMLKKYSQSLIKLRYLKLREQL